MDHFLERMKELSCKMRDALVRNTVRDLVLLVRHQEKLQGKFGTKSPKCAQLQTTTRKCKYAQIAAGTRK